MLQQFVNLQRRNPYPLYWMLRRFKPVLNIDRYNLWFVSRYDEVKRVLSDYETFSSDLRRAFSPEDNLDAQHRASLILSDPPIHTKLRNLVSKAFTPRAVANLEPRIEQLTHELIDQVADEGRMDLVQDLAYPLPVMVIAEMLGIPPEDRAQFKVWSDQVVRSSNQVFTDPDEARSQREADMPPVMAPGMGPYFKEIIAQRRADPQDDLISGLVAVEMDGERLSEWDLLDFCSLLLVAGNVTTTNLIGNAMLLFLKHRDALAAIQEDRKLLPGAIEEVLRYRSPVQFMFRVSVKETEMGGRLVPPGQRVFALIGSANRDEEKFPQANRFDILRKPNPHIAFGHGIHYCLGAPLARLEANVALNVMLERLTNFKRVGVAPLPPSEGVILNGVSTLPLRFEPQPGG
jgi:cytochrome P450